MLIVIEGSPATGKSYLSCIMHDRIRRCGGGDTTILAPKMDEDVDPIKELIVPLLDYRPGTGHNIICDSWHWSAAAQEHITPGERLYIDMVLQSRGGLIIHVDTPTDVLFRRTKKFDINALRIWKSLYNDIEAVSPMNVVNWSTVRVDVDSLIGIARRQDTQAARLSKYVTYVGPTNPDVVICGPSRSRTLCRDYSDDVCAAIPAFVPVRRTTNARLLEYLASPNVRRNILQDYLAFPTIGIISTNDVDDVRDMYTQMFYPNMLALGTESHKSLTSARISHGAMKHLGKLSGLTAVTAPRYIKQLINSAHDMTNHLDWQ